MDTFCPLGPAVVTKESISDINNLTVKTWVNGKLKQDGNTSELIFKPHEIVAYISQLVLSLLFFPFHNRNAMFHVKEYIISLFLDL